MTDTTNSYDPVAYSFTCPVTGLYLFSLSLFNQNGFYAQGLMYMDKVLLAYIYSNDGTDSHSYSHSANTVVTKCERGQRVWVNERCTSDGAVYNNKYVLFSGVLINTD